MIVMNFTQILIVSCFHQTVQNLEFKPFFRSEVDYATKHVRKKSPAYVQCVVTLWELQAVMVINR